MVPFSEFRHVQYNHFLRHHKFILAPEIWQKDPILSIFLNYIFRFTGKFVVKVEQSGLSPLTPMLFFKNCNFSKFIHGVRLNESKDLKINTGILNYIECQCA